MRAIKVTIADNINKGYGTMWSPIQSVIIQVTNKVGPPQRGSNLLVMSMKTDRNG